MNRDFNKIKMINRIMDMSRITLFLLTIVLSTHCLAQAIEPDYGKISLNVVMPPSKDVPAEATALLETKLKQIATRNGIADNGISERFVLTAKANVVQRDIAPSNPPRISQKLEITFFVGDVVENKIYETAALTVAGMGTTEIKAYIAAFNSIGVGNKIFAEMITNAKAKITAYYNEHCEGIIKSAQLLENQQKFDEAVYALMQVPNVCTDCYNRAQNRASELLLKKINYDGKTLLQQATAQWAKNPNAENAVVTLDILKQINIMADCQPQVQKLITAISDKLREDEKRQWEFMMQQYNDDKAREQRDFEFLVKQHDDNQELSKKRIEANRQVAVEYAKNQPKEIYNTVVLW